jgi:hypothetical protein
MFIDGGIRAPDHTMVSASGFAAEDGAAIKVEPASAALSDIANSLGVRYPRLLCGLSSLYSLRQAAISAVNRTGSGTSSPPNTLLATVRGNFPRARPASAFPAECVLTRSAVPHTTPENAGSSISARSKFPFFCKNHTQLCAERGEQISG